MRTPGAEAAEPEIDPVREKYIRRERYLITDMIAQFLSPEKKFTILEGGASDPSETFAGKPSIIRASGSMGSSRAKQNAPR